MKRADPVRQRLVALGLLGVLLLNFPMLGLPGGYWGRFRRRLSICSVPGPQLSGWPR